MIRAIVTGAAGRMGSQIIRAVRDAEGFELVGATERTGTAAIGLDAGLAAGLGMLEVQVQDSLTKAVEKAGSVDVVIDFTNAEASVANAAACVAAKVALVLGSTGIGPEAREAIEGAQVDIPLVMAPNMSVGVNVMLRIAGELAVGLGPGYDIEVLELHHRNKIDAPSGTAVRLAEVIAERLGRRPGRDVLFSRKGNIGERPYNQIGVQALRGGDIVGEHTVYFIGDGERIELTHRAWSRDQFAVGAVRAARWVVGRPPGLYSMSDVLGG